MARRSESTVPPPAAAAASQPGRGPLRRGGAFDDVEGQDGPVGMLRAALAHDRLSHAYLAVGPSGVGKEMVARRLAAALLCHGRPPGMRPDEVCGACDACARVDRGLHPDVHLLLPEAEQVRRGLITWEEERKPAQDIKVDQVRELRDAMRMTAFEGGWRVAIIPQADRLRVEAANALLKTLEEPLPRSLLVLCTPDRGAVLETLRSRCQRLAFSPLSEAALVRVLTGRLGVDAAAAPALAAAAEGSVGRALQQEADRAEAALQAAEALRKALGGSGPGDLLALAERLEKDRDGLDAAVRALARLCLREARESAPAATTDGAAALRARALLEVAESALVLRSDLARPGANARLNVERFLVGAQARVTGSRTPR